MSCLEKKKKNRPSHHGSVSGVNQSRCANNEKKTRLTPSTRREKACNFTSFEKKTISEYDITYYYIEYRIEFGAESAS